MSNTSNYPVSVKRFVKLVGAPIPKKSQDIELYTQDAFRILAGKFANRTSDLDALPPLEDLSLGIREIAGRYNLTLPGEPKGIVPFIDQLGQEWVRDQWPVIFPDAPKFDPSITRTDPGEIGYEFDPPGTTTPPTGTGSSGPGSLAPAITQPSPTRILLPNGKSYATAIQICVKGRPISRVKIWNGLIEVDDAPSEKQFDKQAKFPLLDMGGCYNFKGRCTHILAYGATVEKWDYRVRVLTSE